MESTELVRRAIAGDPAAREEILVRHADVVLRWARATCRDRGDAEDVAQDALIAASQRVSEVRDPAAFEGWLRAVTRNTCARRRRLRAGAPPVFDAIDEHLAAADPGPDEVAAGEELRARLAAALDGLDAKYREVVILRDVEGFSAPEVAERLGLHLEAVKSRLHRARGMLRDALAVPAPAAACPDIAASYSQYLEGELDGSACEALQAHVEGCTSCAAACAVLRQTVAVCRTMADPPPDLADRIRAALRAAAGA